MVFAVRCPAPNCRKYMLVEEKDQGRTVACLICKSAIAVPKLDPAKSSPSLAEKK